MKRLFSFILMTCMALCCSFALCGCFGENPPPSDPPSNTTYNIITKANVEDQGTVFGSGTYTEGEWITIAATPSADYKFVKWNDNNTQNPRKIKVKSDFTYIAHFEKEELYALNSIGIYVTEVNDVFTDIEVSKFAIKLNDNSIGGYNHNVTTPYDNQGFDIYSQTNNFKPTKDNPVYVYTNLNENNVCSGENTKIRIDFCIDTESSVNADYDVNKYQEFTITPNLNKTTRTLETITVSVSGTSYSFNLNIVIDFVRVYPQ